MQPRGIMLHKPLRYPWVLAHHGRLLARGGPVVLGGVAVPGGNMGNLQGTLLGNLVGDLVGDLEGTPLGNLT